MQCVVMALFENIWHHKNFAGKIIVRKKHFSHLGNLNPPFPITKALYSTIVIKLLFCSLQVFDKTSTLCGLNNQFNRQGANTPINSL